MQFARTAALCTATILVAGALIYGLSADLGAGARVDSIGKPEVVEITSSPGTCTAVQSFIADDGATVTYAGCGTKGARTRISARCSDKSLPLAYIDLEFELGSTSNYVRFYDVCSASADQIRRENERPRTISIWKLEPAFEVLPGR
jgi:hypothetical protein